MSLDMYVKEDVARVLAGLVVVTIETCAANGASNTDHLEGAMTMARGVAFSFGLPWIELIAEVRRTLDPEAAALIAEGQVSARCLQGGPGPGRVLSRS